MHPTQVTHWNKQLLDSAANLFEGRQTKAVNFDVDELCKMIDPMTALSVSGRCRIFGLARLTNYYERGAEESAENLALMETTDRLYLAHPRTGRVRW